MIGEDYEKTYTSVARLESVRLVCTIVVARKLTLWQVDFVSAFLNSNSNYEVYMEQLRGFKEREGDYVWKLKKTLYGTMQDAHDWAMNLNKIFEGHGYYRSKADLQIKSRTIGDELTIISTWTDNVLGVSSILEGEKKAKNELQSSYEIKDSGDIKLILGIKINRNPNLGDIRFFQQAYAQYMLIRFNMSKCASASTLLSAELVLSNEDSLNSTKKITEMSNVPY